MVLVCGVHRWSQCLLFRRAVYMAAGITAPQRVDDDLISFFHCSALADLMTVPLMRCAGCHKRDGIHA